MKFAVFLIALFALLYGGWQMFSPLARLEIKRFIGRHLWPLMTFALLVLAALYAAALTAGIRVL